MMLVNKIEHLIKDSRGALHVGANIGEERSWYATMGFKKVFWFEANRELLPELYTNIQVYPGHRAFNFGIHDTLKNAMLNIANNKGQSSSILELGTHAISYPKVKYEKIVDISLWRMDDLFETLGWDMDEFNFLNVDVQGVELNVMKSFGDLIEKLDYIYTEVNTEEVYKGCCLIGEIDDYLAPYGFKRALTEIKKAQWGDALYIKQ